MMNFDTHEGSSQSRDQWFHSSLGRDGAERLLALYPPGAFLLRKATTGDYSLSVVGPNKAPNHFVLEQQYGLIRVGSKMFSNLESVVDYYSNQSLFADQDLSLSIPINPPVLHVPKRVRCKFPYISEPDTDELTVQYGEILIVHQETEPDWIWAESLLSNKHGAVFADLIELLPEDADPFLGYSWFNNERQKSEIVEMLKAPKVRAGTFVIRPAEDCRGSDLVDGSGYYTLFVRSKKSIDKMRIERNRTGRVVFGGRIFDSVPELLLRYQSREVREGTNLVFPLQIQPPSPALPDPGRNRRFSSTSNSNQRTKKSAFVKVYMGKNLLHDLPHGSWKRFWARIDRGNDDELTFLLYEHEKKSRPKVVHKLHHESTSYVKCGNTLFNKDVLVINNRQPHQGDQDEHAWTKYLSFDTSEECTDWANLIDKLIVQRKSPIKIRRSVSVNVQGAIGFPNKALDCLVCFDGIPVGRTLPQNGPDPTWHLAEEYATISNLPETATFIIRKVTQSGSEPIAKVNELNPDHSNGHIKGLVIQYQTDDELNGASLIYHVSTDYRILLPEEEFERLFNLLVGDISLIGAFGSVTDQSNFDIDLRKVALATVKLYRACRLDTLLCLTLLDRELEKNLDAASLWRGNTFFTAVIESVIRLTCSHFLALSLKELVTEIATLVKEPQKMQKVVSDYVLQALCSMNNTADLFPKQIRHILSRIRLGTQQKWPDAIDLHERVIANFLFLRYIAAGLTSPVVYDLSPTVPTLTGQKVLTQVAKSLQHAANGNFTKLDSSVQRETKELLTRLSTADNFADKGPHQPPTLSSLAGHRSNELSDNLDVIFNALVITRPELSKELSDRTPMAILDFTSDIYVRYKNKLSKCNLLK